VLLFLLVAGAFADSYWFSTTAALSTTPENYRGCYGTHCVYVAKSAINPEDTRLFVFTGQQLWAVKDTREPEPRFVESDIRPVESPFTEWTTSVASEHFVPATFDATPYLPVKADPIVAQLVAAVNEERIKGHIERLADFFSRNSLSTGAVDAARYLEGLMRDLGCQNARQAPFRAGYGPNVICELPGSDPTLPAVLVGGHFDSRSTGVSDPNQRPLVLMIMDPEVLLSLICLPTSLSRGRH